MSFPTNTEHMLRYPEVQVQQESPELLNEQESKMFTEFLNSWMVEEPQNSIVFQHPMVSDVGFGVPSPNILSTSKGGYQATTGYGVGFGTGSQTINTSNGYMYPITSTTMSNNNTYATPASAFQNGGKVVSTPYIKAEPSIPSRRQRSPSLPLSANETQGETSSSTATTNHTASASSSSNRGGRGKKGHELLTEAEKKANHIASEQKRRQNIRSGFDQLVDIVPTLSQCHRSEALILQKSVEYIQQLLIQKSELKERVKSLQATLGDAPEHLEDSSSEGELDLIF